MCVIYLDVKRKLSLQMAWEPKGFNIRTSVYQDCLVEEAYVLSTLHWLASWCFHGNRCTAQTSFLAYPTLPPLHSKYNSKINKQTHLVNAIWYCSCQVVDDYSNWRVTTVSIIPPSTGKAAKKPYILSYSWEKWDLSR